MPPLQRLILDAWQRLKPQVLGNPAELARRLARRGGRTFSRPPRAWCLAVRASDRRLGILNARINPEYATDPHDPDHPGRVIRHTVTLTPTLLRELCRPVQLDPPGELWDSAAKKLGTSHHGLTAKRISGALRTRHIKGLLGRRGRPVPLVFTPDLLDPCMERNFAMPHPLWTGNECVSARLPNNLQQTIVRVPVYAPRINEHFPDQHAHPEVAEPPERRPPQRLPPHVRDYVWYKWSTAGQYLGDDRSNWRKHPADAGTPPPAASAKPKRKQSGGAKPSRASGSLVFRGWRWMCPRCNRLVRTIYLPVPPAELPVPSFDLPEPCKSRNPTTRQAQLVSNNSQLTTNNSQLASSFACGPCHRIRGFSAIAPNSWNDLVSYFSGGLLYGHEVPIPPGYRESARRKNRYTPQINRPSPRRELLLELLLQGLPAKQIAAKMHLTLDSLCGRISWLLKHENVPDRPALAIKHGRDPSLQPDRRGRARRRREQVHRMLMDGLTYGQIATNLGRNVSQVREDTYVLCREHGVKGRKGLIRSLYPLVNASEHC